jgi:LmbE family N-acetylglucosaminyl deacetylase
LWAAIFALFGRFGRAARYWCPPGGQRVLVVAPHPDDEVLGCGGTIARHVASGDSITVLIVTDGRRSRAGGLGPDEMAAARRVEAQNASTLMKIDKTVWLGLPEGDWAASKLEDALLQVMTDAAPNIIYAPCWLDYHPEHRRVAACLGAVVGEGDTVRIYTLHIPLRALANVCVDVSSEIALLGRLFSAYATQQASLTRGMRLRRYSAAINRRGHSTEEFCELTGAAYKRAHRFSDGEPVVRGLRYWSFSDPLAYWVGQDARRQFARRTMRIRESSSS